MADIKQNTKDIASNAAKQRKQDRIDIGSKREVKIPKMPAWKINALNQVGEDTLRQVLDKLSVENRVIVVRPTGFGKSYMLAGITSCNQFKNCLYVYPTKVIKSDMLDTYGIYGEDSRAGKLKNTTFITYHMLGQLVRAASLELDKSDLIDEYIKEMNEDDTLSKEDESDTENIVGRKLTIRKLGNEQNVYDTSTVSWYNSLVKSKSNKINEYKNLINEYKARKRAIEAQLKELADKKSKAVKKINNLNTELITITSNITHYESIVNNFNSKGKDYENTEKTVTISSKDDLRNWLSQFDLILIDEAHKTGSYSFVSLWQGILKDLVVNESAGHKIKMVGATATPYRLDGKSLEQYIFGENSRLKSIDINDCIKANNWEYLGIDLNKIMEDGAVIDEGTTLTYLQSRGLFKSIDYVYAIHNMENFSDSVVNYLNKHRQSGNGISEDVKDKMLKAVNTPRANKLLATRQFCKLNMEERKAYTKTTTNVAKEIKNIVSKDMSQSLKEYALERCEMIKKEDIKDIFIRKINYTLTSEDMQYVLEELNNRNDVDTDLMRIITREENYMQPSELRYIRNKIEEHPSIVELLRSSVSSRNTYGLNYMKFIIFFASSSELNSYIARDKTRNNKTLIGNWFSEAFPGYTIFEASLHTGKGTQGVAKIKTEELGELKPADKVIDLIYCVDQLNMGYHIENITGVILLRNTDSASVYNQQIGRCCSVRAENNTIMIDIIDKKPIEEIIERSKTHYEFGLDKDGKQKDLKYLLEPECINVCDYNKSLLEIIDNMRDMQFTNREIIRFLYFERKAPLDAIVHMTKFDKKLVKQLLAELVVEKQSMDNVKHGGNKDGI